MGIKNAEMVVCHYGKKFWCHYSKKFEMSSERIFMVVTVGLLASSNWFFGVLQEG